MVWLIQATWLHNFIISGLRIWPELRPYTCKFCINGLGNDNLVIEYRKYLNYWLIKFQEIYSINIPKLTSFLGARDFLKGLSELHCDSDVCPEFFCQLSKICHNIQTLNIIFVEVISSGLTDLISTQQSLKYLHIEQSYNWLYYHLMIKMLLKIWQINFSQLQILKFQYKCPEYELLKKFLKINVKELYFNCDINNSLNLAIANFCPNLRKLFTGFNRNIKSDF